MAGSCENGEDEDDLALVRFTADGDLDATFGDGGVVTEDFAYSADAVAIDDDGNIIISGSNGEDLVVAGSPATAIWTATTTRSPIPTSPRIRCNYSHPRPTRWATRFLPRAQN